MSAPQIATDMFLVLLLVRAAATDHFNETFDSYAAGKAIIAVSDGLFKTVTTTPPLVRGTVQRDRRDAANRVLEHRSTTTSVITRFVDGRLPAFTGRVVFRLDIQPISGKHGIYLWEGERRHRRGLKLWFRENRTVIAIVEEHGKEAHAIIGGPKARWESKKWYRLTVRLQLNSKNAAESHFDAEVANLTDSKVLGAIEDKKSPWSPTVIGGGQILSSLGKTKTLEARFDNWCFDGDVLKPTKRPAARPRTGRSIEPPFTPKAPTRSGEEIVFEPYLPPSAKNLVVNGDIEDGMSGWHKGEEDYAVDRAANFDFKIDDTDGRSGTRSLYIRSRGNVHSGYWSQYVPVAGGKTYLVNVWAKIKNARVLVWLAGSYGDGRKLDQRIYLLQGTAGYLIPVFLHPRYTTDLSGDDWGLLSRTIAIPQGMSALRLSIGSYFGEGEMWLDDISVREVPESGAPVRVCVRPKARAIKRVHMYMQSTGDEIHTDALPQGAQSYDKVLPNTDITREGYGLKVTFADRTSVTKFCPNRDQQAAR